MNENDLLLKIQEISRDVFDKNDLVLTLNTTMEDIDGWDSLSKISLFSSLSGEFSVKFSIADLQNMGSVSDVIETIKKKWLSA